MAPELSPRVRRTPARRIRAASARSARPAAWARDIASPRADSAFWSISVFGMMGPTSIVISQKASPRMAREIAP